MAHLAGRCTCGRRMHFPWWATFGHQWVCHRCGRTWTYTTHGGNPLHYRGSRRTNFGPRHGARRPVRSGDAIGLAAAVIVALLVALRFLAR